MSGKDVASKPTQESSVQEEPLSSTSTSSSSTTTSLNGITFPLMMVIVNVNKGAVQVHGIRFHVFCMCMYACMNLACFHQRVFLVLIFMLVQ